MKLPTLREVGTEARLLLIGIPVFIWTMIPIYHMFLFAISPKEYAFSGKIWPEHPTLHNFEIVFRQQHYFLRDFYVQFWNSVVIAAAVGALTLFVATAAAFSISRLKVPKRSVFSPEAGSTRSPRPRSSKGAMTRSLPCIVAKTAGVLL